MIPKINARSFAPRLATNLGGFMSEFERTVLIGLARMARPSRVLEIGVQRGEAAHMLLKNVPCITGYVGVDVEPGYVFLLADQEKAKERPDNPGELVLKDLRFKRVLLPRGSFDLDAKMIGNFDMVLIDGDHSRAAVTNDTELADKVINQNGLIVWHDYGGWCEDINGVLNARQDAGHKLFHAEDTQLAWELV